MDVETLKPLWHNRNTFEGGYEAYENYYFDHNLNQIISETRTSKRPNKVDTLINQPCTYDLLSLVYYARNLDFSKLTINDTIPVSIVLDNEIYHLFIRYLGKVFIENGNDSKYRCIKFSVKLVEGTIFEGGEDLFVWVTDDNNRIPVLIEAKILVGSVKAILRTAENIRNESTAKIK
jgi:hypothetical protein